MKEKKKKEFNERMERYVNVFINTKNKHEDAF